MRPAGSPSILDVDVTLIVGPMRTGTTFLARTFDTHPAVEYLGFELTEQWSDWTGLPFGAPGSDDRGCPPLGLREATPSRVARARAGLSAMLRDRVRRTGRAPGMVVLKNPHLWHRIPFVLGVLPHVRIIRTSRDLRGTVASLRRLWDRSLQQHGRVHHLPEGPDWCWDYIPTEEASGYEPDRTFPDGDIRTLAEFIDRVESQLDRTARRMPDRLVASVHHRELVEDFEAVISRLQHALALPSHPLHPPERLDPSRLDEWRQLLSAADIEKLSAWC